MSTHVSMSQARHRVEEAGFQLTERPTKIERADYFYWRRWPIMLIDLDEISQNGKEKCTDASTRMEGEK